jgi:CRISP-associated protein Cas1
MESRNPEPLVRVMALHSLSYCERLYFLEEVEEIRIANDAVYAGRALHVERTADDPSGTELRDLHLASEKLGLQGRVDAVRTRDGLLVPYEHKRGRARQGPDGSAEVWPSDALQIAAYAMLLEEEREQPLPEGRVRYHADNVTVRVPITASLRQKVLEAVDRARQLSTQIQRPPVTDNPSLCARCSLAPVCLPEEERLARLADSKPPRLFPAIPDRQTLHVVTPGARVSRSSERLEVRAGDAELASIPIREVGAVVLQGYVQMTTQAIHLCADNEVSVHWVSMGGRHIAALATGPGKVQRRIRQYQALTDPGTALHLARRLALARMESQLRFLLRASRGDQNLRVSIATSIETIRAQLKEAPRTESINRLRGYEGTAGRAYFEALPALLIPEVREMMQPHGRSRRPPRDRFNAALSFGYALLYRSVLGAVMVVGLEPAFGFFHTPRSAAHPLVLDLMELFRVPLWDMPLVASCNRRQWDIKGDFVVARDHVWLTERGRRKAIEIYERRLLDSWRHPVLDYSLSYARTIELEGRLLEKEWTGSPGLFGRARLR